MRYIPYTPNLLNVFYHERILCFVQCFSAFIEMIIWFLSFILLMWYITFIDLHKLNHPCIPGMNPTWSWCMILLTCCWIWFASILFRIFAFIFIMDQPCNFGWDHRLGFMVRQATGCTPLLEKPTGQISSSGGAAGYALWLGGVADCAVYLDEVVGCAYQSSSVVDWAPHLGSTRLSRLSIVTVQAPCSGGATCYAQQLSEAAGLALSLCGV